MKKHKTIINHSTQHPQLFISESHLSSSSPSTFKQSLDPRNSTKDQEFDMQHISQYNSHKIIEELQSNFQVFVDIGDGRSDLILMNPQSNAKQEAIKFCEKHGLEDFIIELLQESLKQQQKRERTEFDCKMKREKDRENPDDMDEKLVRKVIGAQRILAQNRLYRFGKASQQIWKQPQQQFNCLPKVNQVSQQIVQKVGKSNIIQTMHKKFQIKAQQQIQQQAENAQMELKVCSFHPLINPISRQVDESINFSKRNSKQSITRYEYLYDQHKEIECKKEMRRRNSMMEIPFRPQINQVSQNIMKKKRSVDHLYPLSASKHKSKSKYLTLQQENEQKETRKSISFVNQSNLCSHLYEEAKKRKEKVQKQTDRIYNNKDNWKIMQNSNSLANSVRQKRIKQIYCLLSKPPHQILRFSDININKLSNAQKVLMPLFDEMRDTNESLTQLQFVESALRLMKYISPNERAVLIRKQTHTKDNKQNFNSQQVPLGQKSRSIIKEKGYGSQDIYMRGLIFKSEVKNQIEKGKQEKVRQELRSCTFKPRIHSIPQNIGY